MADLSSSVDLLRRFLIGEVTDDERRRIEEACLDRNSDTFAAVVALEEEIGQEYADGRLTPAERRRFESRVIAHPGGRERLLFARALSERARRAERAREFEAVDGASLPRWSRPFVIVALAAAVALLAVATSLLFWQTRDLRRQVADAQAQAARLAPAALTAENRVKTLEDQLAQEQSRRQSLEAASPQTSPVDPNFAAVTLAPGVTRAPGAPLPQMDLRAKTWARMTLLLPPGTAAFSRYEVSLVNANGQTVWTISELRQSGGTVTAFVPADRVARDDYEVVLRGRSTSGTVEDLSSYYFRVAAK